MRPRRLANMKDVHTNANAALALNAAASMVPWSSKHRDASPSATASSPPTRRAVNAISAASPCLGRAWRGRREGGTRACLFVSTRSSHARLPATSSDEPKATAHLPHDRRQPLQGSQVGRDAYINLLPAAEKMPGEGVQANQGAFSKSRTEQMQLTAVL